MVAARGSAYVAAAILIWSSLPVVVRLVSVPVHELIFYSVLVSTVLMSFIMPLKRYREQVPRGGRFFQLLLLGPVLLANTFTFFFAYRNTTISNAILTHYTAPVLVALMAPFFLKEALTKRVALSVVVATAGLWILIGMTPVELLGGLREPGSDSIGIVSGLCSGVSYAVLILMIRAFSLKVRPVPMCYFQNLFMVLILLPFIKSVPWEAMWILAVVGIVHSTAAPLLYFKGMQLVKANRAAIVGYIEPVGAIIFGMFMLGEYPPPVSLIGGALILFSGYIALSKDNDA